MLMFKNISISIKAKNMKLPEELTRLASDFTRATVKARTQWKNLIELFGGRGGECDCIILCIQFVCS